LLRQFFHQRFSTSGRQRSEGKTPGSQRRVQTFY
jgi:hypothetical protein